MAAATVPKLYQSVIEDVINNVREAFLDEGVDEQILVELKQTWEKKLSETKALESREAEMSHVLVNQQNLRQQQQAMAANAQQHSQNIHHQQLTNVQQARHTSLTHQLTLPAGNMVPQILQYTSDNKGVTVTMPQKMTISLPTQMANQGGIHTVMSGAATAATLALPAEVTASFLQQAGLSQGQIINAQALQAAANAAGQNRPSLLMKSNERGSYQTVQGTQVATTAGMTQAQGGGIIQLDGPNDTSDDDDDDEDFDKDDDDHDDNDDEQNDNEDDFLGEEEVSDPLNSEDDVSDDDPSELFDTDNVVVCQYDKITRSRNRWKFHLKDGIMNLQGRDFVFQKAVGDAEW